MSGPVVVTVGCWAVLLVAGIALMRAARRGDRQLDAAARARIEPAEAVAPGAAPSEVLARARDELGAQLAVLFAEAPGAAGLRVVAHRGEAGADPAPAEARALAGAALATGATVTANVPRPGRPGATALGAVAAPVTDAGTVRGALYLAGFGDGRAFGTEDRRLLAELARLLAPATAERFSRAARSLSAARPPRRGSSGAA